MRFYSSETLQQIQNRQMLRTAPGLRGDEYIGKLEILRQDNVPGKNKVVIIGAGMAGLCAAYELKNLGFEVTVLEAQQDHIGGRVRTHREADGLYAELGAMRIPGSHTLTRKYIHELGLTLRAFVQRNPAAFCLVRNHVFNLSDEGIERSKELFNLESDEAGKKYDQFWTEVVLAIIEKFTPEEITDLFSVEPKCQNIKNLDKISLYEIFHQNNVSEEAIEFVITHFGLETYLQTSLAEHLREEQENIWDQNSFSEIVGGTDMLAKQFFTKLGNDIITSAEVFKIRQGKDQAIISYNLNGVVKEITGDYVICTAPLGVVASMNIEGFSFQKSRAIRRINYDSSTKVLARVKRRFWELDDKIYGGGSIYDSALGHTWYPSDNAVKKDPVVSAASAMFLASYTWGQAARRMDAIPEDELMYFITSELMKVHKTLRTDDIEKVIRWSWTENAWSRGAFAFFNPGEHRFLYKHIKSPENRVLLAGEHCSLTHSWIQGAFESAIDACCIIVEKIKQRHGNLDRELLNSKVEKSGM